MFARIPWDVWVAALAAAIMLFVALCEFAPFLALYLYFALAGAVVVMTIKDD